MQAASPEPASQGQRPHPWAQATWSARERDGRAKPWRPRAPRAVLTVRRVFPARPSELPRASVIPGDETEAQGVCVACPAPHRQETATEPWSWALTSKPLLCSLGGAWQPCLRPQRPLCVDLSKGPLLQIHYCQLPESRHNRKTCKTNGTPVRGSPGAGGRGRVSPSTFGAALRHRKPST